MKYSLRTKLSLSYIIITLMLVILISFSANFLLEKQFKNYIIKQQEQKNKEIITLITEQYKNEGNWNKSIVENIGLNALTQGMIIKVKDKTDKVIWDATLHNNGLCMEIISHMAQNMNSRYPNFKGGYVENNYSIKKGLNTVGSVEIGYYGPFYFTDNDLIFINRLNNILVAIGLFSLLLALLLGTLMARRLSKPISKVMSTAEKISKGDFKDRILVKSSTNEIYQLTNTINNLAETLEKQERLRKRMAADMAHELRTPLTTLQSHMEALIDGIWKPDVERFKSCHEEIMRINRMVGDLEKLARFENENIILSKSYFNVSELIQRIALNFEVEFKNKNIEINISGEDEEIFADKDKISQVMINLFSNALKYTPQGGVVAINVSGNKKEVEIDFIDNGLGINPEDLPYIFERFYRADKSRNRLTGGSGIGLTISKAIVEAHKGSITVESRIEKGTEFKVTLPRNLDS